MMIGENDMVISTNAFVASQNLQHYKGEPIVVIVVAIFCILVLIWLVWSDRRG